MSIQVISFNCVLKNKVGQLISSTSVRGVLNGSEDSNEILPGLAKGLQNLTKGERRSICLTAEEAYGLYDPKKVILYPRKKLAKQLRVGELISIAGKSGLVRSYKIIELLADMVRLDGNHPLAGQDLVFEVEAISAREATNKEISSSMNLVSNSLLH